MDFYTEIYTAVSDKLAAIQNDNNPLLRWVDFNLGQLKQATPPVSFPCALIGFEDFGDVSDYANGSQSGTQEISIELAFKVFERTHSANSLAFKQEGLKHLAAIGLVNRALNNLGGDNFKSLTRMGVSSEQRADLRVYIVRYTCMVYDDSGVGGSNSGGTYVPYAEATNWQIEHPNMDNQPTFVKWSSIK